MISGDERGAGTNAKVWIEMFDEKREGSGKIQLRGGSFERIFHIENIDSYAHTVDSEYDKMDMCVHYIYD